MLRRFLIALALTCCGLMSFAQRAMIRGSVTDTTQKLQNSSILLIRAVDSVLYKSIRTDAAGAFEFKNIPKGRYQLTVTYPKMADYITTLNLSDSSKIDLGLIKMELQSVVLQEVVIRSQRDAIKIRGDTIIYQADSFKVAAGANVQELLKRLPGFEVDKDGVIKAQGKEVTNVLVDGDEFFGDDPLLATKYLKANAVKEVEVYDKKSKNAELTGIDDGKKEKTVNIKLKDNAKNGYIANIDGNSNAENYNDYGGMAGIFKNKLKAAVFGTKANIGLQSKVNRAMSTLKGNDYEMIEGDNGEIYFMGNGGEEYFNPTSGLPDNLTLGAHLSNKWKDNKRSFKLNYQYLDRGTFNLKTSNSQQLLPNGTLFVSSGNGNDNSNNIGNDLKGNFEMILDSLTTIKFSFGLKETTNEVNTNSFSETHTSTGLNVSQNNQLNTGTGGAGTYNGNINLTKKFKTPRRTLSIDLQPDVRSNNTNTTNQNKTLYYDANGVLNRTDNLNLLKDNSSDQMSIASKINYSEPLSKLLTLQTSYAFKYVNSESHKISFDKNILVGGNPKLIDSLSNNFKFQSMSHIGKGVLQLRLKNFSINGGLEATQTNFDLNDLDRGNQFNRNYINLAPNSNVNIKLGRNSSVSVNYNGLTRQPTLDQLQPIREINNPLYQVVGNPNLRPSFSNNLSLNFNSYLAKSGQSIYAWLSYGNTSNEIVSNETIDQNNKRVITYQNISGNKSYNGNFYYDRSFSKLNMSIGISGGFYRSERTAFINNILNTSISNSYNARISPRFYLENKASLNYSANISISTGKSTIGTLFNGNSITHSHDINGTIQLPYKIDFTTGINLAFRPANKVFPSALNTAQWNSSIGIKAMKNDALQLRIAVNDILNQKIGYNRYVGGSTISENTYSFIPRYVLLGVNYNISGNFASANTK